MNFAVNGRRSPPEAATFPLGNRPQISVSPSRPGPSIFLTPHQRLTDNFVLICAGEMPQEPCGGLLVNERGNASDFWAPPAVQLNHILAVIDASLK